MPEPAYMIVKDDQGNEINQGALGEDSMGTFSKADHVDEILIQAFDHGVTKPTSIQSGQVTGQRVHLPVIITKHIDKTSPILYDMMCHGKQCQEVIFNFYRTEKTGNPELYYTIKLKEALIVDMKSYIPNCLDPNNASYPHLEQVKFSYKQINWDHVIASTAGQDSWDQSTPS